MIWLLSVYKIHIDFFNVYYPSEYVCQFNNASTSVQIRIDGTVNPEGNITWHIAFISASVWIAHCISYTLRVLVENHIFNHIYVCIWKKLHNKHLTCVLQLFFFSASSWPTRNRSSGTRGVLVCQCVSTYVCCCYVFQLLPMSVSKTIFVFLRCVMCVCYLASVDVRCQPLVPEPQAYLTSLPSPSNNVLIKNLLKQPMNLWQDVRCSLVRCK